MENDDKQQVTALLANEQTFLAWLRTGIEVMAFGFVAIKFALFASQVMGIILVSVGILMIALSYFRYRSTVRQLRKGQYSYETLLLTVVSASILILSLILLYCLITAYLETGSTHGDPQQEKQKMEKLAATYRVNFANLNKDSTKLSQQNEPIFKL